MSTCRLMTRPWNRFLLRSFSCDGELGYVASAAQRSLVTVPQYRGTSMHAVQVEWGLPQQFLWPRSSRFLSDKAGVSDSNGMAQEPASGDDQADANPNSAEGANAVPQPPPSREKEMEIEVKELKDQLLRSLAEQENTRRIAKRDVEEARNFAIKTFAKSLLDVSDNLTRALEAVPEDHRANRDGHPVLATLYEGIKLTDQELTKAFEKNGLVKYCQPGELFDPNLHDALYEYNDPSKKPGTIGQVMKPGFMLNRRVLRPAEVGVIKKT